MRTLRRLVVRHAVAWMSLSLVPHYFVSLVHWALTWNHQAIAVTYALQARLCLLNVVLSGLMAQRVCLLPRVRLPTNTTTVPRTGVCGAVRLVLLSPRCGARV